MIKLTTETRTKRKISKKIIGLFFFAKEKKVAAHLRPRALFCFLIKLDESNWHQLDGSDGEINYLILSKGREMEKTEKQ